MFLANRERIAGNLEGAVVHYQEALARHPVDAHHPLGVVLAALGRTSEAEACLLEALQLSPGFTPAQHSLALLLLSQGRYSEGWPLYESRRRLPALQTPNPKLPFPEWAGEDLRGKRVLVFGEQGFGDQIMFGRFLASLRDRAAEVIYVCAPALTSLFPGSIPAGGNSNIARPDYWALVGSLPLLLGSNLESLPPPLETGVINNMGGGVGVIAVGNPVHGRDALRSLRGSDAEILRSMGQDISPEATGAADFLETAKRIASLSLVITVDTAMAHLAASMGKPTWVLLQGHYTDWRWLRDRADSPWYPSATLYRQRDPGDWTAVLAAVKRDLEWGHSGTPHVEPPRACT
jgi:tetratricopeptide (TPR) repeat protein